MSKTIKELFLFPNYKIIVFNTFHDHMYYTVKGSHVCYSNGNKSANSIESDFMNNRIDVSNYKMLGKLSELTEGHAMTVFKEARYGQSSYPNFMDIDGDKFMSSLVSLKSYLASEGWSFPEDKTWIIIPKPTKKLVGNKIDIEFEISNEKFDGYIKTLLPVYFSPIKSNTTEITYTVETPDYLYDFLTHHPETDKRPKSKIYTTNVFSSIITHIRDLSSNANNLRSADEDEKKAKKMETDKIPTSEEILDILIPNKYNVSKEENEDSLKQNKETLIGWVELHIQEALKYASEKGTVIYVMDDNRGCYYQVCKESILKSYPLSKIK